MPFDTPRPAHCLTFEQACEITGALRPVSPDAPAWFATVPLSSPDYGKVFPHSSANPAFTAYSFDRAGDRFARLCPAPEGQWLEVQGRHFEIVGAA